MTAELAREMEAAGNRPRILLPDLAPLTGPLTVIETVHRVAVGPVAFAHAQVVHVMSGRARVETPNGSRVLSAGDVLVLAAATPCSARPDPWVRAWTIYLDESFLRQHMRWALPEHLSLSQGVPPSRWDGSPLHLRLDPMRMSRLEPILRRMSVTAASGSLAVTARMMALFAQTVDIVVPAILAYVQPKGDAREHGRVARAIAPPVRAEVRQALRLLEERLAHSWRMSELTAAVCLSGSQLTRLFNRHLGVPPIRMLIELRLTEFARLVEETDLPVGVAARQVGWSDPGVATNRFRSR